MTTILDQKTAQKITALLIKLVSHQIGELDSSSLIRFKMMSSFNRRFVVHICTSKVTIVFSIRNWYYLVIN